MNRCYNRQLKWPGEHSDDDELQPCPCELFSVSDCRCGIICKQSNAEKKHANEPSCASRTESVSVVCRAEDCPV